MNYALPGYTFDSSQTDDSFSCTERCLDHNQCKSYNYALSGPQQGLCELNSAGRNASTPLQYRPGFVFVQAILKQVGFDSVLIETRTLIILGLLKAIDPDQRRVYVHNKNFESPLRRH